MQQTMWIVLADASSARIFTREKGNHHLHLVQEFNHPESRKKASELVSDGSGRYKSSATLGGGAYSSRTDPKTVEAEHFAIELVDSLREAHQSKKFNSLVLVMPPHFQSLVKNHLQPLNGTVHKIITKDYTDLPIKKLESLLPFN